MKERMEILKSSFNPSVKLMNSRSEIHGKCKHHPDFHRFSTDESHEDEKVEQSSLNNHDQVKLNIQCRINSPGYFNDDVNALLCRPLNAQNNQQTNYPLYIDV